MELCWCFLEGEMYVTEKCNHRSHTAAGCCCFSELLTEVCSKPQPVDATFEWRWCGYLKLSLSATSLCHRDRVPTLLCFFRGPLADIVHALRTNPKDTNLASGPFPKSWLTNHEANHELPYSWSRIFSIPFPFTKNSRPERRARHPGRGRQGHLGVVFVASETPGEATRKKRGNLREVNKWMFPKIVVPPNHPF